jgi:hypothetical protein
VDHRGCSSRSAWPERPLHAGRDDTYSATASVYIGQTTDANGNVMAGLNSNASAATQLLDSDAVRQKVAEEVGGGMTAAELRRQTSVDTPSQAVRTTQSIVNFRGDHGDRCRRPSWPPTPPTPSATSCSRA